MRGLLGLNYFLCVTSILGPTSHLVSSCLVLCLVFAPVFPSPMSPSNDVARLAWNVSRRPATSIKVNCRCLSFGPFISSAIHPPCLCPILVGYVIVSLLFGNLSVLGICRFDPGVFASSPWSL
ncbi:hypothetical protein BDW42DRAFT_177825 [Aspergillus taichungensis]|uniref:Uncharacterized protein n=1 Tax=Aspergillus taichungensis TaxID=482145 RepID=A0A2J5HIN2_9EURO|nr:hypothetical protein BDW42DRAFT_177825 [Aspergillus taichungensis]